MAFTAVGDPIHGEVVSSNASAGVAVTLYNSAPALPIAARVQKATEYLTITDVLLIYSGASAGLYNLVFYPLGGAIADGVGLRIVKGQADVDGGVAHHFETPVTGPRGYGVALIADSGQVDLIITGGITAG